MNVAAVRKMRAPSIRERVRVMVLEETDAQTCVTRCAKCSWYFRGTVRDGKQAFASHRDLKHGQREVAV